MSRRLDDAQVITHGKPARGVVRGRPAWAGGGSGIDPEPDPELSFVAQAHDADIIASDGTTTAAKPTGTVEGDLMVAGVMHRNGSSLTAPVGWELIANPVAPNTQWDGFQYQAVYVKVAGPSEPSSYQWSNGGSRAHAGIATVRNSLTGGKYEVEAQAFSSNSGSTNPSPHDAPSVDAADDAARILFAFANCAFAGFAIQEWTTANGTVMWGGPGTGRVYALRRDIAAAGATGPTDIDHGDTFHDAVAVSVLVRGHPSSFVGDLWSGAVLAEGGGAPVGDDAIAMEDSGAMLLEDNSGSIALED